MKMGLCESKQKETPLPGPSPEVIEAKQDVVEIPNDPERQSVFLRILDMVETVKKKRNKPLKSITVLGKQGWPYFIREDEILVSGDIGTPNTRISKTGIFYVSSYIPNEKIRCLDWVARFGEGEEIRGLVIIPSRLFKRTVRLLLRERHQLHNIVILYMDTDKIEERYNECVLYL